MTARVVAAPAGRRVAALHLAGGIHAARARDARHPMGPGGDGPWRLLTAQGVLLADWDAAFDAPLSVLRGAAAELAALPVPWATGGGAELDAALVGDVRARALGVLRAVVAGAGGGAR